MNSILKVKDKDGNWIDIAAIKGEDGKSAYEQAKEGGYTGTEEEFNRAMADLSHITGHTTNKNNPHGVTAQQIGATSCVTGTYTGTAGYDDGGSQTINLGFKPRAVIVFSTTGLTSNNYFTAGMIVASHDRPTSGLEIIDDGFIVTSDETYINNAYISSGTLLNYTGLIYSYIAFK